METEEGFQPVFFEPRELRNLLLIDELESLCPIMDMKVSKRPDATPKLSMLPRFSASKSAGQVANLMNKPILHAVKVVLSREICWGRWKT